MFGAFRSSQVNFGGLLWQVSPCRQSRLGNEPANFTTLQPHNIHDSSHIQCIQEIAMEALANEEGQSTKAYEGGG